MKKPKLTDLRAAFAALTGLSPADFTLFVSKKPYRLGTRFGKAVDEKRWVVDVYGLADDLPAQLSMPPGFTMLGQGWRVTCLPEHLSVTISAEPE